MFMGLKATSTIGIPKKNLKSNRGHILFSEKFLKVSEDFRRIGIFLMN